MSAYWIDVETAAGARVGIGSYQPVNVIFSGCWFNLNDNEGNVGIQVDSCYGCHIDHNTFLGNSAAGSTGIRVKADNLAVQGLNIGAHNYIALVAAEISDAAYRANRAHQKATAYTSAAPCNGVYWYVGETAFNSAPAAGAPQGWVCTTAGYAAKSWAAGTAYSAGDFMHAPGYSRLYVCKTSGTSDANPSNQPSHASGDATDGTCVWTWLASSIASTAVFTPFGQVGYRSGAATPAGSVTPNFVGEDYFDSTAKVWYKATGATNSDWVALN